MRIRLREPQIALLFLIPAFIGAAILLYYPMLQTVIYSLYDLHWSQDWLHAPFTGLQNYRLAAKSPAFWGSLGYTLYFSALAVSLELCIGLAVAMATFSVPRRLGSILRATIVVPWVIPPIISAMMWKWLLDSDAGLLGYLVTATGVASKAPLFLVHPVLAMHAVIMADVWKNSSIVAIMLLGGLAAIPQHIYDAAKVDGARAWFRVRRITVPMLLPSVLVVLLFRTIDALRMFDLVYALTGGGPGTTTDTLSTVAYKYYFTYSRFGVGSAYSTVLFALIAALALFYFNRIRTSLRFKR
jgi:ABC-type sugar transport system permease subunit